MVGLPNTRVVPDDFQQRHAGVIAATFRSTVRLMRLGNPQGVRDPAAGKTAFPVPWPVHEGQARIQSRTTGATLGRAVPVADRLVTLGAYLVALPTDSEPGRVGDVVEVLSCPDYPALNGLELIVVDVPGADIAWQRSYGCNLRQPTIRG